MNQGLYQKQKAASMEARRLGETAAHSESPQEAHDAACAVIRKSREAADLSAAIEEVEENRIRCAQLITAMEAMKHKSPHVTLALRHLEDAESRLVRELGQP